jgi:hypothetical protein
MPAITQGISLGVISHKEESCFLEQELGVIVISVIPLIQENRSQKKDSDN